MKPEIVYKKIVMYEDLNPADALYGGTMLKWMDEAGAIFAAERLGPNQRFTTLKVSEVLFKYPSYLGDLLTFYAELIRVGRTSFGVSVSVQNRGREIVSCDISFVALDADGKPTPCNLKLPNP